MDTNEHQRTAQQNKSIHKWCRDVAFILRESGLDVRTTLKPDFEIEWSENLVKEILWKQTEKIMLGKESTTELTTKEVGQIYEVINRFLAKHEIHVPFPSNEMPYEN